mgnify:CR=1 FL=1
MIYTVTFNPSLDYIVSVENFQLGLTNRTSSEMLLPGGKGINVSTVLMNLGIESTALGFTAGFTGDEIIRRLEEMGVRNGFIQVGEGFSRINLKLKSIDGTEINGQPPSCGHRPPLRPHGLLLEADSGVALGAAEHTQGRLTRQGPAERFPRGFSSQGRKNHYICSAWHDSDIPPKGGF